VLPEWRAQDAVVVGAYRRIAHTEVTADLAAPSLSSETTERVRGRHLSSLNSSHQRLHGRNLSAMVLVGADSGSVVKKPTRSVDDRFANRLRPALSRRA